MTERPPLPDHADDDPADEDPGSGDVVDVTIERAEHMTVTFGDGLVCAFAVEDLRAACPCATCRGQRERGEPSWPRPGRTARIEIADARFSGAWGVSVTWSDGHDTGIYAWSYLRRLWRSRE